MLTVRDRLFLPRRLATLVAAIIAVAASGVAGAADPTPAAGAVPTFSHVRVENASPEAVAAAARESVTDAGLRAFIDPVTGTLREPTREEVDALNAAGAKAGGRIGAPTVGMRMIQLKNGAVRVTANDAFMSFMVVRHDEGALAESCVVGETEALRFVAGTPMRRAKAPKREEALQ